MTKHSSDMSATEIDLDDIERRMDGALAALRTDLASLRTGRASGSMLDAITVDAYGTSMPINQLATVNVPEPRMVTVSVWDKSMVGKVEKAIRSSGLGLNPVTEGTLLRRNGPFQAVKGRGRGIGPGHGQLIQRLDLQRQGV